MNENLIYDVGCNNGCDSINYLKKGFDVVAVECSPELVCKIKELFKGFKNFTLVDKCIHNKDGEIVKFYLSELSTWNSCSKEIAERKYASKEIEVETITLQSLFDKYGIPKYCKIDIEGNDILALNSLISLPEYISCETECIGNTTEAFNNSKPLEIIDKLNSLGFNKFKLVDQRKSMLITPSGQSFVGDLLPWEYPLEWIDFETCSKLLLELRSKNDFSVRKYSFWYDVVACKK